jgi:glyoxylase-like metal-dependent hydrolase (beta-lactamase superfamily II)
MEIIKITVGLLATNCYLLIDKGELAVVDPGGEGEKILEAVKKAGARPKMIINTHYHFDHTLANVMIQKKLGIPSFIHEREKDYTGFEVERYLSDGDEIRIGESALKTVLTPGHTLGSICLFSPGIVISGDTIFENGVGRWDLPGGSLEDLKKSLELLSRLIKPGTMVYPGHGEIFKFKEIQWI